MVHSFQDVHKSFDSELLNIIYRILRLSSAGMQVLRIVLETASRTVELALQSDQYSAEQINLILRQANRVCTRDRDRLVCASKVAKFFVDVLGSKTKLSVNSFFKLLGLLLNDQGVRLVLDEQVQYQVFGGGDKDCDHDKEKGSLLIGPTLTPFISAIMDALCERDFKFLAVGNDNSNSKRHNNADLSSLSALQTPSMSSNVMFSDSVMRSTSVVEIKVGLGQLLATLNVCSHLAPRNPATFEHQVRTRG